MSVLAQDPSATPVSWSNQRAYRKEEIPVQWLGRMARFNLAKVRRAMEKRAKAMSDSQCTKGRAEFVHAT